MCVRVVLTMLVNEMFLSELRGQIT